MISAEEFREYNRGAAEIGDGAASAVEQRVLGWCRSHEDATVAEKREAAKLIMEGFVQAYDDKAAVFASQWYDYRAEQGGARLKQAVTMTVYEPGSVDDVARYQAKKLAKEGDAAFARACGEFARNDAFRSLNETIIANVGRDRDKGAMFARVPTGTETCTFCLMLASRGAVYHSRKTAGEWRHFHRGCDCKVVPSFEDDPMATLVDGKDPNDALRWYTRVESAKSSRITIPGSCSDTESECAAIQEALDEAWDSYLAGGKTKESYREHYASFVRSFVTDHPIQIEDFTILKGKELQEAAWLARTGHDVLLRNPDEHKRTDGNTSDSLVDGVTCDFKKVTSSKTKKVVREIVGKLDRQGPMFLLDLSSSSLRLEDVEVKLAKLLDDQYIESILIVKNGLIEELKK